MTNVLRSLPLATWAFLFACSGHQTASLVPTAAGTGNGGRTTPESVGLVSNGGKMQSFDEAINLPLRTDADYAVFVDPEITGANRTLAIKLLEMMPPNKRGDFIYISADGRIFSNRIAVEEALQAKTATQVENEMRSDLGQSGVRPQMYPPSGGAGGPYIRNYSAQGVTAAYGYATVPCQYYLNTTDSGDMYFNAYSATSSGSVVDGGLEMGQNGVIHPFLNVEGNYAYSGWTNESQTYSCGTDSTGNAQQPIGIMFGSLWGEDTIMLAVGLPNYSPYVYQLPPNYSTWDHAAWIFYQPAPAELFASPGQWDGINSPCTGCSVARMFTIAQNIPSTEPCFGACNGYITGRWDQVVMGELIQPCNQVPGKSAQCTIEYTYTTDGSNPSWYSGENDSNTGINYQEDNANHGFEGINLQYTGAANTEGLSHLGSFATPIPMPTSKPSPSPLPCRRPPCPMGPSSGG